VAAALAAGVAAGAQTPWRGENLQYFRKDIPREELVQRMREFSFALGVRCQHCHAGGDGVSLEGVEWASDDKPAKQKARAMLRLVDELNTRLLPRVPARAEPRVEVGCVTCHHGLALPKTLQTTLFEVVEREGAAAAVARYRELRRNYMGEGAYDFGQWEMNELARRLVEADRREAAVAILELNAEFYPESSAIQLELGELKLALGARDEALRHFRAIPPTAAQYARAVKRIAELEKR
jgi:hypothetical protein